ncbi:MAG TPA: ATP-binding protein [Acidimicrobiales bacterium]|nr:ATP-binding protein [Acidimicrobiales bacterium]
MAVRAGGLTARRLPAIAVGSVLAAGSVLGALAVASAEDAERRARLDDAAEALAERVADVVERHVVEVERLAAVAPSPASFRIDALRRLGAVDEITAFALAERRTGALVVVATVPREAGVLRTGADLAAVDELEVIVERVVTEADPSAGGPVRSADGEYITVAAPVVADVAAPEAARRASVSGAVLGAVDARRLLAPWEGTALLVAPDGRSVGAIETEGRAFRRSVEIQGRAWQLLLDAPGHGWPGQAWLVLGAGLSAALALAIAFHVQLRRRHRAEVQARERSRQLERIADAGARLQQSLDLSELLPAFCVALSTDFDLRGVAVSLLDEHGEIQEAFSTGERLPDDLDGTASIELPLRRGFRAVGILSLSPGRVLDHAELTSLQALADLLAVAMSNAQLYEREQLNAARLRDLDALKNAFLGTVSHELRTSMTAIMGFGELLAESWDELDESRRREMADRIRRSAGSLRHLVDDLLDFARLEQERLRVSPRAVDLARIVRQTVDTLSPLLGRHEIALSIADSVPAHADPVAVERILANLVSNAAKYSPEGTVVTISVQPVGDRARLVVADQGPGIPAEERRRIFARFYRLETPAVVRTRGAGIGLAVLRDFADRSGATVDVDEAEGGGARFTVDFPTSAPAARDDHMAEAT